MKAAQAEAAAEVAVSKAVPSGSRAAFKEQLMATFKEIDVNDEKFVKKIDLRKAMEALPGAGKLVELVATIKALKEMLIDKKEFENLVDAWAKAQ